MDYELLTIDGRELLKNMSYTELYDSLCLPVCVDTILLTETYPRSALFDQLRDQLKDQFNMVDDHSQLLKKVWIYVDFQYQIKEDERHDFERLFEEGFYLRFPDEEHPIKFVPLLNSSSQSKRFIYGFVRDEIFWGMRKRLDLELEFKDKRPTCSISYISKLYAYRALYSSGATSVLRGKDKDAESFFDENNIIVLPEPGGKHSAYAYTATQGDSDGANEVSLVSPGVAQRKIEFSYLDGAGIISKEAAELINDRLPQKMRGNSFQMRMPFLKGVLHTVDFHKFFADMGICADKGDRAIVRDVFGKERDLTKANIIVTPSMFKLYGLLSDEQKNVHVMEKYFEMIQKYNHGLYVVKTEASFHNNNYVPLNSQLLSTLDLTAEDLDDIIRDHMAQADAYCAKNLLDPEKREALHNMADRDDWMTLLYKEPAFLNDSRIREMLKNHRKSRYHDIALGRIRVRGENRFLCGDLLNFLNFILDNLIKTLAQRKSKGQLSTEEELSFEGLYNRLSENYKRISGRLLNKAVVYIPGADPKIRKVAMLRNPHLSRNEDVCVGVGYKGYYYFYKKYFSHLTGVVFVGHRSRIPNALGGADFDGDHVILSYDERIIRACSSGYVEDNTDSNMVPFIHIPTLKGNNDVQRHKYVVPQAVYNSFSNRIGIISNAAMKIAAVEYDATLPASEETPSAAFCTILTGTEIDACKKGLRPDIDDVIKYRGEESEAHRAVVEDVETYIRVKDSLESFGGRKPSVSCDKKGVPVSVSVDGSDIELRANREHNAITQLLYRWAEAFAGFSEEKDDKDFANIKKLDEILSGVPSEDKRVGNILIAYNNAYKEFTSKRKKQKLIREKCEENNAKLFMRLMGQYDDINVRVNGEPYRNQMDRLQERILSLTSGYTVAEVQELRDALFGEAKEVFSANTYWPYGKAVENNKLLEEILGLPEAYLLKNFHFEGYRLLCYLLDNALSVKEKEPPAVPDKDGRNPYNRRYLQFASECFLKNYKTAEFEKELAKIARRDLYSALDCHYKSDVIKKIYPPKSKAQLETFWDLFTAGDMLNALGGDTDVR